MQRFETTKPESEIRHHTSVTWTCRSNQTSVNKLQGPTSGSQLQIDFWSNWVWVYITISHNGMGPSGLKVVPVTIKFWGHVLLLCVDKNSEEGVHTMITLLPPSLLNIAKFFSNSLCSRESLLHEQIKTTLNRQKLWNFMYTAAVILLHTCRILTQYDNN